MKISRPIQSLQHLLHPLSAPTHPKAPPEHLESLPWPQKPASGRPTAEDLRSQPAGPLKLLVEEAERREEQIPGLVYEGDDIKLGLGDFIFYSILVGRASLRGVAATASCVVAVLAGLCATLALLPVFERALPALPISIAAGTAVYFSSTLLVAPLAAFAAEHSVFL